MPWKKYESLSGHRPALTICKLNTTLPPCSIIGWLGGLPFPGGCYVDSWTQRGHALPPPTFLSLKSWQLQLLWVWIPKYTGQLHRNWLCRTQVWYSLWKRERCFDKGRTKLPWSPPPPTCRLPYSRHCGILPKTHKGWQGGTTENRKAEHIYRWWFF